MEKCLTFDGSLKLAGCPSKVRKKSRTVYHTFVNCLDGRALQLLRSVEPGSGLVAWRKLNEHYAPATAGRFMSVLSGLMALKEFYTAVDKDGYISLSKVLKWRPQREPSI